MKLYTMSGACSLTDHIVLEWIGHPYEVHVLERGQQREPAYMAINPFGGVPALVLDNGKVLTQNVAILSYLADRYPQAGLGGEGIEGRAEVMRWLCYINSDVHAGFKPLFGPNLFVEDATLQEVMQNKARARLREMFGVLNNRLAGREWLCDAASIADPYLFVVTRWARGKQVDLSGFDHLDAFFERMRANAGVKAAMKAEGLTP
ncbi:glutathione S-transferase N-terminal domain-containing protein [Dyella sp.]|uniref:glutathione S-transferase N-terminal domain-containing protein n=1 Tax=Dyella sp. TaxID=1869338 RepID=UPI002ED28C76